MKVTIDGSGNITAEGDLLSGAGVIAFPTNRSALPDFPTGYKVAGSAPSRVLSGPGPGGAGTVTISVEEQTSPLPSALATAPPDSVDFSQYATDGLFGTSEQSAAMAAAFAESELLGNGHVWIPPYTALGTRSKVWLDNPGWLSKNDPDFQYRLSSTGLYGAQILLGDGLGTKTGAANPKAAFYVNQAVGQTVVSDANCVSGSTSYLQRLIVENIHVTSKTSNGCAVFAVGNNCQAHFHNVFGEDIYDLWRWISYADLPKFSGLCRWLTPRTYTGAGSETGNTGRILRGGPALYAGASSSLADGLSVDGAKFGNNSKGIYLDGATQGGVLSNGVGGRHFLQGLFGLLISGWKHDMEQDTDATPMWDLRDFRGTLDTCAVNAGNATAAPNMYWVNIDDSANARCASDVMVRSCTTRHRIDAYDDKRVPDIWIAAANDQTVLRVRDTPCYVGRKGANTSDAGGLKVGSAVAAIQTALDNNKALVAGGNWDLVKINNVWSVVPPHGVHGVRASVKLNAPPNPTVSNDISQSAGTGNLTNGDQYKYQVAYATDFSTTTELSTAVATVTAADGPNGPSQNVITHKPPHPGLRTRIWRTHGATPADPSTNPAGTDYVELPSSKSWSRAFDTGPMCHGEPWITKGAGGYVDPPATASTANTTFNGSVYPDGSLEAAITSVVSKTGAYTAKIGEAVLCDPTGGAFAVTLPAARSGALVHVKNKSASTNAITVTPAAGTIDGAATNVINTAWTGRDYLSDGTNWVVV